MRPLETQCQLALGDLWQRSGESARAREQLTSAAKMFGEMGMQYWLRKAETPLGAP